MNAPILWIVLPLALGGFLLPVRRERLLTLLGGTSALILGLLALLLPIDTALGFGAFSFKVAGSLDVLGRSFALETAHGPLLAILYGLAAMWFFGAETLGLARRLIPLGLAILGLMVAALAVRPFLYAAVFIEIAVLLSVPMLLAPQQQAGRGILRYVIFQTLATPFILFAGWLLAGVEVSPGDVEMTAQAAVMLAMGFAFLLAVFPLYIWIPMLLEEAPPYLVGFLLWLLPQAAILFAMGFLDRYPFLRHSPDVMTLLRAAGLLTAVSAGIWAAFQRHLGRLMGYAAVAETGLLLLALGLGRASGVQLIFMQMIPRGVGLSLWALSLSVLQSHIHQPPRFAAIQGIARRAPLASAGAALAHLSAAGFPLLAGFPIRLALLESLASPSLGSAAWLTLGLLGLLTGAVRTLAALVLSGESRWEIRESPAQAALIALGILMLLGLGLFPQLSGFLLENLPSLFEHLGEGML